MSSAAHPNWAVYDLDRLMENLAELRRRGGPDKKIFAAIKGDAYGHGALAVARSLERGGVSAFMTGAFEEALALRSGGITAPIVMFAGALAEGMGDLVAAGLVPTVVDMAGARAAAACGGPHRPASVYVKVDMGLGRLGVPADEAEGFLVALAALPGLHVEGFYTHLPFADHAGHDWAANRFAAFDDLLDRLKRSDLLPAVTQAGASSSVAAGVRDRANSICVGHLLFGLSPFSGDPVGDISAFKPVLSEVGSHLVQVTDHSQGRDIAIAGAYRIERGRRIGVAPIGAANGLQRPAAGSEPAALVRGRRVPIISVSLEHLTLDLDRVEDAEAGDRVLLLGHDGIKHIGLEELAAWSGLSCLDMILALSGRLTANYCGGA